MTACLYPERHDPNHPAERVFPVCLGRGWFIGTEAEITRECERQGGDGFLCGSEFDYWPEFAERPFSRGYYTEREG